MNSRTSISNVIIALALVIFGGAVLFDVFTQVWFFEWKYVWSLELFILGVQFWLIWRMAKNHSILETIERKQKVLGIVSALLAILAYNDVLMHVPGFCGFALLSGEADEFYAVSGEVECIVDWIKASLIGLFLIALTFKLNTTESKKS